MLKCIEDTESIAFFIGCGVVFLVLLHGMAEEKILKFYYELCAYFTLIISR